MTEIRRMIEADLPSIEHMEADIFSDAWSSTGILESFGQPHVLIYVAEDTGKIIGYCIVYYIADESEIVRIAVDKTARNQGVGHMLLSQAIFESQKNGMGKMILDVRESNDAARRLYAGAGFKTDGIRRGYYDSPKEDAVLMSREFR